MRGFQRKRGLRADASCGRQTWSALVEAGYRLGDRLLYYTTPMLRGDDVASLQRQLSSLGFDMGRIDGIFGDATQRALLDFQRNAGLTVDATCGPETVAALERLGSRSEGRDYVSRVREREELRRSPTTLAGRRVVVGHSGGLDALARAVTRTLVGAGAIAVSLHPTEGSAQAAQANAAGADVYLGLSTTATAAGCTVAYYAGHGFESAGGRRLAQCLDDELSPILGVPGEVVGMAIPILRETRMPAVLCELGPPSLVVEHGAELAAACRRAFTCWTETLPQI